MRKLTLKNKTQKMVIVIMIIMLFNFIAPKPVQADVGGILVNPIISLFTFIADGLQGLLQRFMISGGEPYMLSMDEAVEKGITQSTKNPSFDTLKADNFDGSFWSRSDDYRIPNIRYSPEEIFSNKIPMLDINYLKPSVKSEDTGEIDEKRNTAFVLRPVIASWYVAIRTVALVGLLSVLLYLGIRMLMTSLAADRAKYKKMLMDWVVAMCLLFLIHFIMSFALTVSESITSMIATNSQASVTVKMDDGVTFDTNLIGYVRFMVQHKEWGEKLTFFILYIMLLIYTLRFTWTYLKRVLNMAFLTIIAPMVALTYPIDKVGDSKAQAFDMWIKEYCFNALLQPFHLLLYLILVSSAITLAAQNPLYAIVALGFISSAEKLLRKMFGFEKASQTVGTLAGVAGGAVALNALKNVATATKQVTKGNGGKGKDKLRTKDDTSMERSGKDKGANSGYDAFNSDGRTVSNTYEEDEQEQENQSGNRNVGRDGVADSGEEVGSNLPDEEEPGMDTIAGAGVAGAGAIEAARQGDTLEEENIDQKGAPVNQIVGPDGRPIFSNKNPKNPKYMESEKIRQQQEAWKNQNNEQEETIKGESNQSSGINQEGSKNDNDQVAVPRATQGSKLKKPLRKPRFDMEHPKLAAIGRGVARGARGVAVGAVGAMTTVGGATLGLAAGAVTGDASKAVTMAVGGATLGMKMGTKLSSGAIDLAASKIDSGKYNGDRIAQRDAKADKRFYESKETDEFVRHNFGKAGKRMTQKEVNQIKEKMLDYRRAGITDNKTIKKGLKMENIKKEDGTPKYTRDEIQSIINTKDNISSKISHDEKVFAAEQKNIASQLTNIKDQKERMVMAKRILDGYKDFRSQ